MNQEQINENNRLIAEFMGAEHGWQDLKVGTGGYYVETKYHKSFEWIIPVLEKMQKTNDCDIVIHLKGMVEISYGFDSKTYYQGNLIENLYYCAADFIKKSI